MLLHCHVQSPHTCTCHYVAQNSYSIRIFNYMVEKSIEEKLIKSKYVSWSCQDALQPLVL